MKSVKTFCIALLLAACCFPAMAQQNKYWIFFSDKHESTFDPYSYFDEKSIERRLMNHLSLSDSTDFPVNENYLLAVKKIVDSSTYESRWFNALAVFATENEILQVKKLSFVSCVEKMNGVEKIACVKKSEPKKLSPTEIKLLRFQTSRMQGNLFKEKKIDGTGIRIALLDAGFPGVDVHPAFDHLRKQGKIKATYDFVKRKEFVYANNAHGRETLSCIAGIADSINIGMATGSEFLLARTEKAFSETFSEEENWLAAMEWADKNGADIISSSLGFGYQRYFVTDMNGKKSLVSRAANMAAAKGMLVVNAAGNEDGSSWKYMITPADADSVLAVGGINPYEDLHIGFSSLGPTADNRMKPNVCALGEVMAAGKTGLENVFGTSFATPLTAGFAACAWQLHRDRTNMQLFSEIEHSAHLYPYFDYAHGFGIPQASWFLDSAHVEKEATFHFVIINGNINVVLAEKFSNPDKEKMFGVQSRRNLYFKFENKNKTISHYEVVVPEVQNAISFDVNELDRNQTLVVHFEGYTNSLDLSTVEQ